MLVSDTQTGAGANRSEGRQPVTRRTVARTAAWTVPTVAVVAAAPAFAVSDPEYGVVAVPPTGGAPEMVRCQVLSGMALQFSVTIDGSAAPDGEQVTIDLPAGLVFSPGGGTTTVATVSGGLVQVPPFQATGTAGTYAITATFHGVTAYQSVNVTPAPGSVVELRRTSAQAGATASFTTHPVTGITTAVAGAIMGDAGATSANAAVITDGGVVRYWGEGLAATLSSPGQLAGANYISVDTWASLPTSDTARGGAAGGPTTRGWFSNTAGTVYTFTVSVPGTVRSVHAEEGYSYALTDNGVYRWTSATTGATATPTLVPSTAGASLMSAWSSRNASDSAVRQIGGYALVGSTVVWWRATNSGSTPGFPSVGTFALPAGLTGSVTALQSGDSGLMVLTSTGQLWSYGTAFSTTAAWSQRATGVVDFNLWTRNNFHGGLWIDASGGVTQFFGHQTWDAPATVRTGHISSGTPLSGITKVFTSDGTYLVLASDGTVYAWGGNLDNAGRGPAVATNTGAGSTVDLNVWGHHVDANYTGGGYVIKATEVCSVP